MAEKEYIERGALQRAIRRNRRNFETLKDVMSAIFIVHLAPAADVVEVVRCYECIHRDKKGVCEKFRQRYPFFPEDDFYCGFGAKNDGEKKEREIIYENEKFSMVEVVKG